MKALARAVVDAMAFLELSEPPAVDDDAAVAALEMLSADLQGCTAREKAALRGVLSEYAAASRGRRKKFYESFMSSASPAPPASRPTVGRSRRKRPAGGATADAKLLRRHLDFTRDSGDAAVVAELLDRSPKLVNARLRDGSRPLHAAAMWGYDAIIEALLARGADPNAGDRTRTTPLHWAAVNGHRRACELLLNAGVDVNALDRQGETPLDASHGAAPENAARVRGVLRKHGAVRSAKDRK